MIFEPWAWYLHRVRLYERESDTTSRWVQRETNLMFILSSDKDQRKKFAFVFAYCKLNLENADTSFTWKVEKGFLKDQTTKTNDHS